MGTNSKSKQEGLRIFKKMHTEPISAAQIREKQEKVKAQRTFQVRELKKIIIENLKHQIEIKESQGYSHEEIINGLLDSNSLLYNQILETIVKRTNITVKIKDVAALKANNDKKGITLINPDGRSLDAQIKRFFNDQILILKQKAEEKEQTKTNEESGTDR